MVFEGLYYGQVDGKCDTCSLLDHTPPVLIYSHLERVIQILIKPMSGLQNLFMLIGNVYENVYNSMPYDYARDENAKIMEK